MKKKQKETKRNKKKQKETKRNKKKQKETKRNKKKQIEKKGNEISKSKQSNEKKQKEITRNKKLEKITQEAVAGGKVLSKRPFFAQKNWVIRLCTWLVQNEQMTAFNSLIVINTID